ncbi:MAG: type II toxin-antitoxin system HicA family toxin [Pedosphaera sp.]|nr:type II toxin-antitoxin system HicA family toxin [Pedosphaera sp.]
MTESLSHRAARVKRRELVRQLTATGCRLLRRSAKRDFYFNPATGQRQPVPRHVEVDDHLARHIKKHLGIPS